MQADGPGRWLLLATALLWSLFSLRSRPAQPARSTTQTPDRLRAAGLLSLALALVAAAATPLRAQEPTSPQVVVPPGIMTSISVAHYDPSGRRDPFVPLYDEAQAGTTGPRFETLKLTGIFLGSGTNSLAVLEDPTHRGYFVRLGQQIGTARLVEILPQAAVFEVRDYGATRRIVLRLERTEEGR
jgi:hypothetical protein